MMKTICISATDRFCPETKAKSPYPSFCFVPFSINHPTIKVDDFPTRELLKCYKSFGGESDESQ